MKTPVVYLGVTEVQAIHRKCLELHGGQDGVRDPGLLDAATAMPRATFGGEDLHPRMADKAAAYLFHLCSNHAFLDGNKRVALATAEIFLRYNGYVLNADNDTLYETTLAVADGRMTKEELIRFFRSHVRKQG